MLYTFLMPQKPKTDIPIDKKIGKNIALLRKKKGFTQTELGHKIGVGQRALSHYETGRLHISAEIIVLIAQTLDVTTDEILKPSLGNSRDSSLSLRFTRRIKELDRLSEPQKKAILKTLDDLIRANS